MNVIKRTMLEADKVLAYFEYLLKDKNLEMDEIYLEPYQDGMEHGWSLKSNQKQVSFAKFRATDQIIVYFGEQSEFDVQGNVPLEICFMKNKKFAWNECFAAAQFILLFFLDTPNLDPIYSSDTWKEVKADAEVEAERNKV